MQELVILTGPGGSGKSLALKTFEDLGFYAVDNLPVALLPQFVQLTSVSGEEIRRGAVVVDVREGRQLEQFPEVYARLRELAGAVHVIFLDCRDEVLIRRYQETRRPHPLGLDGDVAGGISRERQMLAPLQAVASVIFDTSGLTVHELRAHLKGRYGSVETGHSPLAVHLVSFGFKHGLPPEASMVFDVRFLPNPYFVEGLREKSGRDAPVADYLAAQPETADTLQRFDSLIEYLLPRFETEGKASVTLAIGCTGGRHRSVYMVEALRARLLERGYAPSVMHRDLERV